MINMDWLDSIWLRLLLEKPNIFKIIYWHIATDLFTMPYTIEYFLAGLEHSEFEPDSRLET